ncbi:MAG: amidohydrolase family protein [Gemmataceae bacterium]|nr:amidohydrolase family protein [Gemmataceae bacterium]
MTRKLKFVLFTVLFGLPLCSLCLCGDALHSAPKPTVFAIRDARVVTEPGKILPKATVVIRDGVIEAVGADAKAPADAIVIDGTNLTVYAGFVDALSHWGYDTTLRRSEGGPPEPVDIASEALAATRPDNRKGLTPEFVVATALKADSDQTDSWRRQGVTAHLIAPDGGIFVGQSALVSLSGAPPRDAMLKSPVAQHAAFRATGAEYPRALMGIVAHSRQALLDAGLYKRQWAAHEKSGRVGRRPPTDSAMEALGNALERKVPMVFEADSRDAIERALDFAGEFRLRPIIYGGRDAWKSADRLREKQVPVILRLDTSDTPTPESEQAVPARVKEDRQRRQKDALANAGRLEKAGIAFAWSSQGLAGPDKFREQLRKMIGEGLSADAALRALTIDAAQMLGVEKQLGTVAAGKAAHLVVTDGDFHLAETQVRYAFVDGVRFEYEAKPKKKPDPEPKKEEPKKPATEQATELEADRKPSLRTGGNVLLRGATVLTVANGTLPKTDVLVKDGKIAKIGAGLAAPDGVVVIDAAGLFVMPGIIDTHSHFAIAGGVNEFSLSMVPEVRVRDVIDSEDVQIYRSLGGGVTTARLLHGSANVIGGQDAVIKLKYGKSAGELVIADAPRGVKFALGENVKRTDGRFPNTRLGVEAVLIRAFSEARAYRKGWEDYAKAQAAGRTATEPRRDLRLEALVDVLKSDLRVHCHCYRSDEILMLLRTADRFGFKVKSLQHVLEGYKIAPEIAEHGASCSTFSDWWAYKIEAYDAIPFNSALLHEAGATVCLKSDSNELVRHLYQEAAKCIKYGGMSETEALKTITLNGAKQLGLDKRIGSIEVGKDADLAIFSGHPLNSYARVEMTLVEGEVYFQRTEKLTAVASAAPAPAKPVADFKPIPRNPNGRYVIVNATVHVPQGGPQKFGAVVIEDGKIKQLVKDVPNGFLPSAQHTKVDGTGLHLYPGMIDAGTIIGLTELGSARETHDFAEGGDFQPDLRASVAINPDSELIPVTRANGVTSVVTRPIGNIVAGQSCLINLAGWVPKEMAVIDPLALHIDFPAPFPVITGDPTMPRVGRAIAKKQREEKVRRMKELFEQALAHDDARKQSPDRPANPRLEALVPYARGLKPVIIQAHRKPEIVEALKLAEELKLKVVLSGAIDAWKVVDELKKRDVPVILGPVLTMPQESYDPYDSPFSCAAKLHEAGVRFCIRSSGGSNTRNVPYEAAMAVSYGLPPEIGIKAVTLFPAQILGVADQLGSIETGKRANLVLANGDILQASTQVLSVFIDGRPLEPASKQSRLYDRCLERLKEVKEGRAPLGTK